MTISADILVVGGGPAGLILTARLVAAGARVVCIERQAPPREADDPAADLRTTAFLRPSIETLRKAGLWERLEPFAAPLCVMRIIDQGGRTLKPRLTADFTPPDGNGPFGYNLPNALLRRALVEAVGERLLAPAALAHWGARHDGVYGRLEDGREISARLIIAADGRDSRVRAQAGISARRYDHGQQAIVCALAHERPHGDASTEMHRTGGPLTLAPLMDPLRSGLVWMTPNLRAARLMALEDGAFEAALNAEAAGARLGRLRLIGRRAVWPIISLLADRLTAPRVALAAEAAHVVPPIGAQGLNMSLKDAETLAGLIGDALAQGGDPGAPAVLEAYERARLPDMRLRSAGVGLLNLASKAEAQPLRDLRALGLGFIHAVPPVRRLMIKAGLGG